MIAICMYWGNGQVPAMHYHLDMEENGEKKKKIVNNGYLLA